MKKKKIFVMITSILLIVLSIMFLFYRNRKLNKPIDSLRTNIFYIIKGDINRATELLNDYEYLNERDIPNHTGLVPKENYTYYDSTNHEVLNIKVMSSGNECIITNSDGQSKLFDMKKKDSTNKKYSVSILRLDPQKGEEEEITYKFLNLINDKEEDFQYDPKTTTIDFLYKANKSIKVENTTEVLRTSENSGSTYTDCFWHNFSVYSYDTDDKAKQVYEKYIKDLYKNCDSLNPNQIKTRSFIIHNEHYIFIYDNYVSDAKGIIGTNGNKMFIFNFLVEDIENNKEYTSKYFDLLNETGYLKNNEIKNFVLNLFIKNNLYNKENYDN